MRGLRPTQRALSIAILTCAAALCQPKPEPKYALEFTSVVDSTGDFNGFGAFPAINNHSEVAFTAARNGIAGVFRAREGMEALATISSTKDNLNSFGADVSINPAGTVEFGASTSSNSRDIFKGDGKSLTLIVDSTASGFVGRILGSPPINALRNRGVLCRVRAARAARGSLYRKGSRPSGANPLGDGSSQDRADGG